jgi:glycosyltransferase involved in cell wall biosynthesis
MRVLLVTRAATGGAARHVLDVVRALGGRHEIACLASPVEDGGYPGALARAGARVRTVPIRRGADPTGDLRAVSEIRTELARFAPEVLHAHAAKPGLLARTAGGDTPVVYSPHGFYHHYPTVPAPARKAALRIEKALAPRTAVLALCAEWERSKAEGEGLGGRRATVVVPNGVPAPNPPEAGERERLRRELGVPEGGRLILMAARLADPKDPVTFLGAAAALPERCRFVLAGDGPLLTRCRKLAPPHALVAGRRDDLPRILASADLAVLATRFEASPYFVLEAMAGGLPVVASDLPATREALAEPRLLVPPGDPAALARAIDEVLGDGARAEETGAVLRERAAERYSLRAMAAATERAWEAARAR